MTTREKHFKRLNDYRNSAEYAEYAFNVGIYAELRTMLPSLLNQRWEIDSRIFEEFRDILPPLCFMSNSFLMGEFCFGSFTTKYSKIGDSYYCEFVQVRKMVLE